MATIAVRKRRPEFSATLLKGSLLACAGVLVLGKHEAHAQGIKFRPSVEVTSVASDNVGLNNEARSDVLLTVVPKLEIQGAGGGYRLAGYAGLEASSYVAGSEPALLIPQVQLNGRVNAVERLLFVDATLASTTIAEDPFGISGLGNTGVNKVRATTERISPYIEREFGPGARGSLRTDHSWIQRSSSPELGASYTGYYVESQTARYELTPLPFGVQVEAGRQASSSSGTALQDTELVSFRLAPSYAVSSDLQLSLIGGMDGAKYADVRRQQGLIGMGWKWNPSERTGLSGEVERRFFGTGGRFDFFHRSPFLAINASLSQSASSYVTELVSLPSGVDVAQLLDASLITRIPNPVDRAAAVQDFISQRNLPPTLASSVDIFSSGLQKIQRSSVSMALLGSRHTLTFRVYGQTTSDLLGANDVVPLFSGNARQRGASISFSRRVTTDITADILLLSSKINGFGVRNSGLASSTSLTRLGLSRQLTPRSALLLSARRQLLSSNGIGSVAETAISAGWRHQF